MHGKKNLHSVFNHKIPSNSAISVISNNYIMADKVSYVLGGKIWMKSSLILKLNLRKQPKEAENSDSDTKQISGNSQKKQITMTVTLSNFTVTF